MPSIIDNYSSKNFDNISSSISDAFSGYKKWFESIDNSQDAWSGKANENIKEYSKGITEIEEKINGQINNYSNALKEYNNYINLKSKLKVLEEDYDTLSSMEEPDTGELLELEKEIRIISNQISASKGKIKGYLSTISGISTNHNFENYYQIDYPNNSYGNRTIAGYGCGVTSMAMILHYFIGDLYDENGNVIDPVIEMAKWSESNGYFIPNYGTNIEFFNAVCEEYLINCETSKTNKDGLINALNDGKMVVLLMNPGDFTSSAHYIVIEGIDEQGNLIVADPYSRERSSHTWDMTTVIQQSTSMVVISDED